ncbi:MAG TPA: hypothetical protein VGM90_07130 [Kofleriaceae bacterium]
MAFKLERRYFCETCGRDDAIVNAKRAASNLKRAPHKIEQQSELATAVPFAQSRLMTQRPRGSRWMLLALIILPALVVVVVGVLWSRSSPSTKEQAKVENGAAPSPPRTKQAPNAREQNAAGHMCLSVSSTHPIAPGYSFSAANLSDGDITTSWQPSPRASGTAWFRIDLPVEMKLSALLVANGFQVDDRLGDEFTNNSRIARARIVFDDKTERSISFESTARDFVRFDLDGKRSRTLTVFVDETFDGTKWHDLAVSEVNVLYLGDGVQALPTRACNTP